MLQLPAKLIPLPSLFSQGNRLRVGEQRILRSHQNLSSRSLEMAKRESGTSGKKHGHHSLCRQGPCRTQHLFSLFQLFQPKGRGLGGGVQATPMPVWLRMGENFPRMQHFLSLGYFDMTYSRAVFLKMCGPTASASPGNSLEMHILRPCPELLNEKIWGWAQKSVF